MTIRAILVAVVAFLFAGSARADTITWVATSPIVIDNGDGTYSIQCTATATVTGTNKVQFYFRKVGDTAWTVAPALPNKGVYGAFINPGSGTWQIRPNVVNAAGTVVIAYDVIKEATVP